MALTFQKAKRIQTKIKLAIGGPPGSGKTMSSLLLGFGLIKGEHPDWSDAQCWDKICLCDTENGSGALYVGARAGGNVIGQYNTIPIEPPFEEQTLIDAIAMCENHGMEVIILDSMTAFWQGEGGALQTQGKIAERTGNSFTSWKGVRQDQSKMMNAILQSKCHIIADYRAKTEYVQEKNDKGKTVVRNIGMGIIAEGNTEYEYSTFFMLDASHNAVASKDRTGLFDNQIFVITPDTGKKIQKWLSEGEVPSENPVTPPAPVPAEPDEQVKKAITMIDALAKEKCAAEGGKEAVAAVVEETLGTKNYKKCTDIDKLRELYSKLKAM